MRSIVLLIFASPLFGAITNVSVRATNTQAVISYTAPDAGTCNLEVSESASYTLVVHDVDETMFVSASADDRAGNLVSGRARVFVVGHRRAEKGIDGHWYSRALRVAALHYYRITCGADTATGTFETANLALGNNYQETLPPDPNAGARPYYSSVGSYAWPEFTKWDATDATARSESVIDPQTGVLLKRVGLPNDWIIGYGPGTQDWSFSDVRSPDSAWTFGTDWTFSGSGSNFLVMQGKSFNLSSGGNGTNLNSLELPLAYLTLTVNASCTGTCAGEDAKIQACLTLNGVTCWPTDATAKYQEVALTGSLANKTFGTTKPILDAWTPAGFLPLNKNDLSLRSGNANVDVSGNVSWTSGTTYFSPNWTTGSKITINSAVCTLTAQASTAALSVDPASCPSLTFPLTAATWSGNNMGFLIRKKTASTETITLHSEIFSGGSAQHMSWPSSGSANVCNTSPITNSVTGEIGYHCVVIANLPMVYWIGRETGAANYLGAPSGSGGTGQDAFSGVYAYPSVLHGSSPEVYYGGAQDQVSKWIIAKCTVTTTNQPNNISASCSNLTKSSTGRDLGALMAEFTAGDTPAFNTAFACSPSGLQGTKLVIACRRGPQDTMAWVGLFDPDLVSANAGCVGGGLPGCVVAAQSTWGHAPARWCSLHTLFTVDSGDVMWIAGKQYTGEGYVADGPYTVTVTAGTFGSSASIAAGTGLCPAGGNGCDTVTVDGEPCDSSPHGTEATDSPCPKNAAWTWLQDANIGDYFKIDNETLILVNKSGTSWTFKRGGEGFIVSHASTTMYAICMSRVLNSGAANYSWTWDAALDPHGTNSGGASMAIAYDYDHPSVSGGVVVGGSPFYEGKCVAQPCYSVHNSGGAIGGNPDVQVAMGPTFAGAHGASIHVERAQDHPGYLQSAAVGNDLKWLVDGRPLQAYSDYTDAAIKVTGDLYRMTTTTTDGDNLSKIGNNIYVVKTSGTTLLAAGNCTTTDPCTIWNDVTYVGSVKMSCTITVSAGTGTIWVSRLNTGLLGVQQSGLTVTSDNCAITNGSGYPAGSSAIWSWGAVAGAWNASGSDDRASTSGYLGTINRKLIPTWAYCGTQPAIDVSSAATGDVIGGTSADAYKYCEARKAGECRTASKPGDIYMNCPYMTPRYEGSYGCHWYGDAQDVAVDMCVGNNSAFLNTIGQHGFQRNDPLGSLGRSVSAVLSRYKYLDPYMHGNALPDASWMLAESLWVDGVSSAWIAAKLPPFPSPDTVGRDTFVPVPVTVKPPSGVDNVIVRFGYGENGTPAQLFCTSRKEACLATSSSVPTIPFAFPSDGTGGAESGVTGLACSAGCTVEIPAISQRMLYYQVVYRDVANSTVATSNLSVIAVP